MCRMDLNHIKAGFFTKLCCFSIRLYDLIDQFIWHLLYITRRHMHVTWSICYITGINITANTCKASIHTAMRQLDIGICSRIVNCSCGFGHTLSNTKCIQLKLLIMRLSCCRMHNCLAICNNSCSAFCFFFQISNHLRSKMAIQINHTWTCRRTDDSVFHLNISDAKWREQMRITFSVSTT